jgi:hypothetical protein
LSFLIYDSHEASSIPSAFNALRTFAIAFRSILAMISGETIRVSRDIPKGKLTTSIAGMRDGDPGVDTF